MEKSMSKRKNPTNTSCVSKISCFIASNSKQVRTSVPSENEQNEFGNLQVQTNKTDGGLCKLKDSAHKIYASLKKMKQTILPGGRLITNLISGIFTTNGDLNDPKKTSESYLSEGYANDVHADVKSKSRQSSTTCPSASSLTRSCLSKSSPKSRHKRSTGMKKKVSFCHVDVEVDEDCHQKNSRQAKVPHVVHKRNDVITNSRQPKPPHVDQKRNDVMKSYGDLKNYEFVLDFLRTRMMIFEDDCSIDWSSDLVELERLSSSKNQEWQSLRGSEDLSE